jgi:hypothetical protein
MSKKLLLWLVPVLVTIHNLEEALFMQTFIQIRNASVPGPLRDLLPPITYRQFLISLIIVTIIPYVIAWLGNLEQEGSRTVYLLLGFQVIMLFNVLAHIMMATIIGGYAPGVVTAVVVNLPFSLYLLHRAVKQKWVSRRAILLLFPAGLILHVLGLPAIIMLSGGI